MSAVSHPLCWICGDLATTREHMLKASELRNVFPASFYMKSKSGSRKIQSVNSDKVKFSMNLCSHCNSARTQPHDRAWDALLNFLKASALKSGECLDFTKVFPGAGYSAVQKVYLYFMKWLGCVLVDKLPELSVESLAKAILNERIPTSFRLVFFENFQGTAVSDLYYSYDDAGNVASCFCVMALPQIAVGAIYAPSDKYRKEYRAKYDFGQRVAVRYCLSDPEE